MKMLWYKAWLETRWRALLLIAIILIILFSVHARSPQAQAAALNSLQFMWMIAPLSLAGSGVRSESPFQPVRGIAGSMYFTMSLPVSRLRLLGVRAGMGALETAGVIVIGCGAAAAAFPAVRQIALPDAIAYTLTIFVCGLAAFGLSTVLATFLDQQWQGFAATLGYLAARALTFGFDGTRAPRFDFYLAMGNGSPLFTHSVPWAAMGLSAAIGAVCFLAAARVEQARQY